MATNNSNNNTYTNNADGFALAGGTTARTLTLTAGNVTLSAGGANTYTMPSATDTLVGRVSTDTLTNKDLSSTTNTFATSALGYAQILADITTTSTTQVQATGLTVTVTVPTGGHAVKITFYARSVTNSITGDYCQVFIWSGTVNSGTQLAGSSTQAGLNNEDIPGVCMAVHTPSAGSITYNIGFRAAIGGTAKIAAVSNEPAFILVELL